MRSIERFLWWGGTVVICCCSGGECLVADTSACSCISRGRTGRVVAWNTYHHSPTTIHFFLY